MTDAQALLAIPEEEAEAGQDGPWRELALYLLAGAAYIALGFAAKQVFAWWTYGAIFAVLAIWGAPALWRRWQR